MQHYHHLDKVDVTLINFKKILAVIQKKFIDDCSDYGLIKEESINLRNNDARRLLMHHTIHQVCEEILNCKYKSKKVIVFRPLNHSDTFELLEYCKVGEFNLAIKNILSVIKKALPIQIAEFPTDISFHKLKEEHDKGNGQITESVYKILCNMTPVNISFESVKKFAKKHKLAFLSRDYFNSIKTKEIFYSL